MKGIVIRFMFSIALLIGIAIQSIAAYSYTMTSDFAAEKSRVSFIMRSVEGSSYNVYIVGEGEKYAGATAPWARSSRGDLIYKAGRKILLCKIHRPEHIGSR